MAPDDNTIILLTADNGAKGRRNKAGEALMLVDMSRPCFGEASERCAQRTALLIFKRALSGVAAMVGLRVVLPMHDALLFAHTPTDTPADHNESGQLEPNCQKVLHR